ncbi:essential MCU regulator, mitochondrial isoform X2 [Oryctolagus cuniculus]|uniref:essential MCU regulator, mitochondrial isoform X2 n=1 Tax=Oryctolagus cuniculus TaxID=9986 RepID=UPI00223094B2|nr:essential MCU regulator, mitochondrial isoform X2 [Oryctolagus cuniculus]
MASAAARRLALAPLRSGALRSGPSLRKGGDASAVRGGSGRSLVPSSRHSDPLQMSFGLLRVFSIVIPFLYVGTLISKNFAALLEEHDIFVPEDDDDDD